MAEQRRSGTFNNVYKFNGKELDANTGLYYYGARHYDPRISNWLSVDPIALWQPVQESEHYIEGQHNGGYFNPKNMSVYGYTYENPIRFIDPNGKQTDTTDLGAYFDGWWNSFLGLFGSSKKTFDSDRINGTSFSESRKNMADSQLTLLTTLVDGMSAFEPLPTTSLMRLYYSKIKGDDRAYSVFQQYSLLGRSSELEDGVNVGLALFELDGPFKFGRTTYKATRALWKLTDEGATAIKWHRTWGKFYKGADGLWWTKDITQHGSSRFKVYEETSKGLEWKHNADEFGDFISNQHKSSTGKSIPWGDLKTIK